MNKISGKNSKYVLYRDCITHNDVEMLKQIDKQHKDKNRYIHFIDVLIIEAIKFDAVDSYKYLTDLYNNFDADTIYDLSIKYGSIKLYYKYISKKIDKKIINITQFILNIAEYQIHGLEQFENIFNTKITEHINMSLIYYSIFITAIQYTYSNAKYYMKHYDNTINQNDILNCIIKYENIKFIGRAALLFDMDINDLLHHLPLDNDKANKIIIYVINNGKCNNRKKYL